MRIAAVQLDIAWEDKPENHRQIEQMLDEAALPAGTFVLLPELGDTGFSFNLDTIVDDRSLQWAQRVARDRSIWLQVGYAERGDDGKGRNCASIIDPEGEVRCTYHKVFPFSYGNEAEYFCGGEHLCVAPVENIPFCPLICYDLRFPELWRLGTRNGAEVFTIGASWPSARQSHWRALLIARAIENLSFVVAVNRVGSDPHLQYLGGSIIVSPKGEVLAEAQDQPAVIQAVIEPEEAREWRKTFPALQDMRDAHFGSISVTSFPK